MMPSKLYPDVTSTSDAIESASKDHATWPAGERAALKRLASEKAAPVIRMRRRSFFVAGAFTFVVERTRGGGFTVSRVPSS